MIKLPVRPAAALLSKKVLRRNLDLVYRQTRSAAKLHHRDAQVMAIVKADAYGHDLDCILPALEKFGVRHFAVASLAEGVEARRLSPRAEILVLGGTFDWSRESLRIFEQQRLKVAVNDLPSLRVLLKYKKIPIHLKLDTGMNRLGLKPFEWGAALDLVKESGIPLDGLFTHFATVSDSIFHQQANLFEEAVRWFWAEGVQAKYVHSENSSSLFGRNGIKRGLLGQVTNLTRPGIALYGYLPYGMKNSFGLEPVLELVSEVGLLKRIEVGEGVSYGHHFHSSKRQSIGIVPLGYADGLSKIYAEALRPQWRDLRDRKKGSLLVSGAICMDMVMLRASKGELRPKDRVAFWGRFPNPLIQQKIVEPYELNLRIAKRIPRIWVD